MASQLIPFLRRAAVGLGRNGWEPITRKYTPWVYYRSPVVELNRLSRQLDRLWDEFDVEDERVSLKDNKFRVNLNVDGFKPQDIRVDLKDRMLTVSGKYEEKSEDGSRYSARQFQRYYRLPDSAQLDQLKSTLAADGRTLRIEAPIIRPAIEESKDKRKETPIQINRSEEDESKDGNRSAAEAVKQ